MKRKLLQHRHLHDAAVTSAMLIVATGFSSLFFLLSDNVTNVSTVYMLAVFLTAKYTEGYLWGIVASVIAMISVNFVFTYPFMELNFTLGGYPITFLGMTIISCITSTLTTSLKKQNQALRDREKLLMEAEKEKMRANLLRAISHDLRTPLTSIIGSSATCLENQSTLSEQEKTELLKTIYEDSNWLLNMVENLLTVTRIRSDSTQVNKSPEVLEEVLSEAVSKFRKRLPQAELTVSVPDDFIMIPMDATLIEQVIINLLENAVYHSGSVKPIQLSVTTEGNSAVFSVTDYGVGIREELLQTVFDGCSPTLNATGDGHKGMGIGLSICKTIIKAHGGDITAENHQDGARFIFTLPMEEIVHES